jgi:hypothetical protein
MFLQNLSFELKVLLITLHLKDDFQFVVSSLYHLIELPTQRSPPQLKRYALGFKDFNYQYQAHPLKGAGPAAKRWLIK